MKYTNKVKRLEARQRLWEALPREKKFSTKKPGSFKK